jgi:hypothetical protein
MAARVLCSTRTASRCLRWRGLVRCSQARASRPTRTASRVSRLAPWRPRGRWGRSISTTHAPWSTRNRVSPAPSQPVPSNAHTRRPAAWASASRSSQACPAWSLGTSRVARTRHWDPAGPRRGGRGGGRPDHGVNLASSMGIAVAPSDGDRSAGTGLGGVTTRRQDGEGHAPRRTGFSIRPATMVGQAGAGSSRTDQPQGTPGGGQRGLGVTLPAGTSLPAPRKAPQTASPRGLLRTRDRPDRAPRRPGLPAPGGLA